MRARSVLLAATAFLVYTTIDVSAYPGLTASFVGQYPTATNLESCGTCHTRFVNADAGVNPYGAALLAAGFSFAAIEGDDSDGDGTSNVDEILTGAGFFPGWTCATYTSALEAPSDLADFVDPIDPGCAGGTTTSTTTSTSTSTTLPVSAGCAQPVSSGPAPVSTDCLFILQAAVGAQTCVPECICSPNGDGTISATDALLCLNVAVGVDLQLNCPC
jgi:hypothetical protein